MGCVEIKNLIQLKEHPILKLYESSLDTLERHCPHDSQLPLLYSIKSFKTNNMYLWPTYDNLTKTKWRITDLTEQLNIIEQQSPVKFKNFSDPTSNIGLCTYDFWPSFQPQPDRKYFFLDEYGNIVQYTSFVK